MNKAIEEILDKISELEDKLVATYFNFKKAEADARYSFKLCLC